MAFGLQDALATLTAAAALFVIVRRVAGAVRPALNPGCANCPMVKDAHQAD
jgi:hypothetical protein